MLSTSVDMAVQSMRSLCCVGGGVGEIGVHVHVCLRAEHFGKEWFAVVCVVSCVVRRTVWCMRCGICGTVARPLRMSSIVVEWSLKSW